MSSKSISRIDVVTSKHKILHPSMVEFHFIDVGLPFGTIKVTLSIIIFSRAYFEHVNDFFRGETPRKSHKTRSRKAREKIIIDRGTFIVPKGSPTCIKWNTTTDGFNILCFDDTTSMLLISMDMVLMVGRKNCSHT